MVWPRAEGSAATARPACAIDKAGIFANFAYTLLLTKRMLPVLLFKISLIQEGRFSYAGLVKLLALMLLLLVIGAGLWQGGISLFQRGSKAQKFSGVLVLVIATAYSLGVSWLGYWEFMEILELF